MENSDVADEPTKFSLRKFISFLGPGFLISVAYLDPGNIESDLRTGTTAGYKLLWLLFASTIVGATFQRLSLRLGVVTEKNLAQMCRLHLRRIPNLITWVMVEVSIIGSDMQEVIGTAIAFYILSNQKIPLFGGVLVTVLDTFLFLLIDRYGYRKLEFFFATAVLLMGIMFGYLYVLSVPDQAQVIGGVLVPLCRGCSRTALLQAVGIVGAVIMPHNIYLHSALTQSRPIDRTCKAKISEANFHLLLESCLALFLSFIINLFVVSTFAAAFYATSENSTSISDMCRSNNISRGSIFNDMTNAEDMNIYSGSVFLACKFGVVTTYIWAMGIMASGQTSTMTGTYTGQFVMQGFLNLNWRPWVRLLITRSIAIGPAILISLLHGLDRLTLFNDFLNVLMSIQLPFALLPVVAFTSSTQIMGDSFVNGKISKVIYVLLICSVFAINFYFILNAIIYGTEGHVGLRVVVVALLLMYISFIAYFIVSLLAIAGTLHLGRFRGHFVNLALDGDGLSDAYVLLPQQ